MENKNQTSDQVEVVEQIISPLHTVTPLSKYLAMGLFIVLPFFGGWIGYTYAPEKVVEIEKVVMQEAGEEILVSTESKSLQQIQTQHMILASPVVLDALLFSELKLDQKYGDFTLTEIQNLGTENEIAKFSGQTDLIGVFVSDASILPPSFVPFITSAEKVPVVVGEEAINDFRLELSVAPDFCITDNKGDTSIASSFFDNETAYYLGFNEIERTENTFQRLSNPVKVRVTELSIKKPAGMGYPGCYSADITSYELL